jgi:hypothetical protein
MNYSVKAPEGYNIGNQSTASRLQAPPEGCNIGNKVPKSILRSSGAWRREAVYRYYASLRLSHYIFSSFIF